MLSLWDLEGIPRGMGSGSCNAGRTELPDLGADIGDIQNRLRYTLIVRKQRPIWLRLATIGMLFRPPSKRRVLQVKGISAHPSATSLS